MNLDKDRLILTMIWIAGLLVSSAVVISYTQVTDNTHIYLLTWPEATEILKNVLSLYAIYVGGILAFWYIKPFTPPVSKERDNVRFWLALFCSVIFNISYVGWLTIAYWDPNPTLQGLQNSINISWLSFLVAPANIYYFGIRTTPSH